jgi:hypothetical protein
MRRILASLGVSLAVFVAAFAVSTAACAEEFFFDDFEQYLDDLELQTVGGWLIVDVNNPVSVGATWTLSNPRGRGNPAGFDGTPSTGQFLISDNDTTPENPTGNGASHDIWSPPIETGGAQTVWVHMDTVLEFNNNGKCYFDLDVSRDGGENWTNVFRRVAPSRFEAPPVATTQNADGYYGQLDVDLSGAVAGADEFLIRLRDVEPSNDWWWSVDDFRVDDQPPPQGGMFNLLAETGFDVGIPTDWTVLSLANPPNAGNLTWTAGDPCRRSVTRFNGGALPYQDGRGVHRLGARFAILDSDCDPDPAEDEYLITPAIDCRQATAVFLHYKDEIVPTGATQEVLLSLDGGLTFELEPLFSYNLGGGIDPGEDAFYHERVIPVPAAAGQSDVSFAFHYASGGDEWWWAVDDVRVTADGDINPRNCAGRNFRVMPFDPATRSVTMDWALLPGDEGFRVLANGTVISGATPLAATVDTFTDPAPAAGASITYSLESLRGGNVEFTCSGPPLTVFTCPSGFTCCIDRAANMVRLSWNNGINVAGDGWRITRNGLPRGVRPFTTNTFSEAIPATPGIYHYELSIVGGQPDQCPELPLTCELGVVGGDLLFFDTFDCYADDAAFLAAGWRSELVNGAPMDGSEWSLLNSCRRANPPTEDGSPSKGKYAISDNDCGGVSIPEGTGQSYDLWSPSINCTGRNTVWLHMDFSAVLNNNGECVIDIEVSNDDGQSWTNLFRRVAPARGSFAPFPQVDIPEDDPGGPQVGNSDGSFGRLHLDLSAQAANRPNVRFRIRHFEPNFDWWAAIDNVVVDTTPVVGGTVTLLGPEGFSDGIPDEWTVASLGTATWRAMDNCGVSLLNSNGGLFPDAADGRQLHHFDHTFAYTAFDDVCSTAPRDEYLLTPRLDCSQAEQVFLHFRSAIVATNAPGEVLLSLDSGDTFDPAPIFSYALGGLFERASEVAYDEYIFEVPRAAGQANVVLAWHYIALSPSAAYWAIDDVAVTATGGKVPGTRFVRGDADGNGRIELTDPVRILNFLFLGTGTLPCGDAADADNNGRHELTDAVRVLNYLFLGTGVIPPPTPSSASYVAADCGLDPVEEDPDLGCVQTSMTCAN